MESPDIVDTSDVEERDILVFSKDIVHSVRSPLSPQRNIRAITPASPQSIKSDHIRRPTPLSTLITRHDRFSDHEAENLSPRKRKKIAHDAGPVFPGFAHSVTTETPLSSNTHLGAAPVEQIPGSPSQYSEKRMRAGEDEDFSDNRVRSQSLEPRLTTLPFPHSSSRSHSVSPDHDPLSAFPYYPTTPSQTCSSNFASRKLHLAPSSPLTPISSAPLPRTPSRSPDPIQLLVPLRLQVPRSPQPITLPTISRPDHSPPFELPGDPHPLGRYSLRRREARQLNPYAYDKLLYKQQLKAHPDAVVKFRSPRRRSGSVGIDKDGTQDEFVFPLDNQDPDGDYVDIKFEGGRRSNKKGGLDQHNELGADGRALAERWLPEILKGLSSSDEDDHEIRRLARNIRRKREKADAKARAEARRAAVETRKVQMKTKKSEKRRPKPFPIHGDAEGGAASSSPRVSRTELSPSYLFPRAHSELKVAPCPPSSAGSILGSPVASRATTHSPPSSGQSSDFSMYLQPEKSYFFNDDHEEPFPQNYSPVNHSSAHSIPSTLCGPPTTSDASALLSNMSGVESESGHSSVFEMSSKDRKRLRVLKRMMPAAMVSRQLGVTNTTYPHPSRPRVAMSSSGSEAEEVPAVPGIARVRKGRYRVVEVRGDPESSDEDCATATQDNDARDIASPSVAELLSDGQSAVMVRRQDTLPWFRNEDDVISISGSSAVGLSSENSGSSASDDEEQVRQSLFDRPPRGPARERSLIDWMLCRTKDSGRRKTKSKRLTGQQKSHGSGAPRFNVVTNGARRYGEQHQTLLSFIKADTSSNANPLMKHNSDYRDRIVLVEQDTVEDRKKRKKKRKQSGTNQEPIYSVHHDATRITSRHRDGKSGRNRTALVIKHDDNAFRQALDPGWRAEVERWNKPVSPARHPATNPTRSAPTAPRPRVCRRTSPRQQLREIPLPVYFQREEVPLAFIHHRVFIDMNITPLPSGIKFGTSSYIGKGFLYQLIVVISGNSEVVQPVSCDVQGLEIGPTTPAAVFGASFGPLSDRLVNALREYQIDDVDATKEWSSVMHASNQLLSWLAVHAEDQEFIALEAALRGYLDGLLLVLDSLEANVLTLTVHWFVVELFARLATGVKYRQGSVENGYLIRAVKQLMQHLLTVDFQMALAIFRATEGDLDDTSLPSRAAELWICLIHLLPCLKMSPEVVPGHPLWRLLSDLYPEISPTGAEASEEMWRTIFSLCALSRFSVHGLSTSVSRLPAAWELVAVALKKITLTANPEKERQLPQRALKKRDDYVSHVVSRCFLLWNQWEWRLDGGIAMFKSLQEIFRSRNFANLLNERSAPMGFFENGDLELLSKRDPHDTVFEVFLKLVVQAVNQLNANVELDQKQRSVNIKKFLQMAVPVSPVPFSRSTPPSTHTLSMLVNRFSAMAVAIHLDPTSANVKFRVSQARRCVSFRDADDESRMACVYGMMNFAMIARHHKIAGGLEQVLGWLGEMANALMDEYKEGEIDAARKQATTTLIQLLLGSVRRVIETQSLDKRESRAEYPNPLLLDGPWVTRVFNPRTDLVTIQQTGVEIRLLVQSFLNARTKALPDVQSPAPPVVHSVESQESQDEYDKLFLDFNDEELLAALGEEAEAAAVADLKSKEDALCKVLDKFITPAVYRLVCKHFGENEHAKNGATSTKAGDEWIDCWVGCANVLIQNSHKDWGLYMKLGQQSWEKIIDDSWRRRVGLRFNLTLLRLDPGAYSKMKNDFITVLLVATLSYKTTMEHEFVSTVLSLDGVQHPLLRGAPLGPVPGTRKYDVSRADYEEVRVRLIETVFSNAARCLRTRVDAESQGYVELVVVMLSTMRDIYLELGEERKEYVVFCRRVIHMALSNPELATHPRLSRVLEWGRNVIG